MKIAVVGDVHWSSYSSILRLHGNKYSYRLENCINSVNWAETISSACDLVVYLGDFFDSSELNAEEITALTKINWNERDHLFLVGNHEMGINDLSISSAHVFKYQAIDHPTVINTKTGLKLGILPYILEEHRESLDKYFSEVDYIFSHNDLQGVQFGSFKSKTGFSIEEIETHCKKYFNGHLHNGGKISDKIINVGNLTGQNFSEDATLYDHTMIILDTDTDCCEVYENPYALNFYKLDETNFNTTQLKNNSIITLRCSETNKAMYQELIAENDKIITSRIILLPNVPTDTPTNNKELIAVNHIEKFKEFIIATYGNSSILVEELEEVSK